MKRLYEVVDKKASLIGSNELRRDMTEAEVEEFLFSNPEVLGEKLLYIGRQVFTSTGKILDLLALDEDRNIVVIELKRGLAPNTIIAQVVNYSTWLSNLSEKEIEKIAKQHFEKYGKPYKGLSEAYEKFFGKPEFPGIASGVMSILVADRFDKEVTDEAQFLNEREVWIRCKEFDLFQRVESSNYYFFVEDVFDEDEAEGRPGPPVGQTEKARYHKLVEILSSELKGRFGKWGRSRKCKMSHDFKIYQSKEGTPAISYIDWVVSKNTLSLGVGAFLDDKKQEYYSVYLRFRKVLSPEMLEKARASTKDVLAEHGFEETEPGAKKFRLDKVFKHPLTADLFEAEVFPTIEVLKPLIERLMDEFGD